MAEDTDSESVGRKVREGTYFSEARAWYSVLYHSPIAERSFFVIVILLAAFAGLICIGAFLDVFPLSPRIPFVVISQDAMEELPHMQRLRTSLSEPRDQAILRYFLSSYVERRESYIYDPASLERNFNNIRSQSTADIFAAYSGWYNASNPASPFNLYGNQITRKIEVNKVQMGQDHARVVFTETLGGAVAPKVNQWVAEIGYSYAPFKVQQDIEELSMTNFFGIALDVYRHPEKYNKRESFQITPMTFVVTSYTANPYITE